MQETADTNEHNIQYCLVLLRCSYGRCREKKVSV